MNKALIIGLACAGFILAILGISICYIKRLLCFAVILSTRDHLPYILYLRNSSSPQCRGDMPVAVDQVVAEEEGKQFAGMRKVDVNHKFFKLRHKKPEPKE